MNFNKTSRQEDVTQLLAGPYKHIMVSGGSRSGKTFILTRSVIIRACKEKSRHAIFRSKFNHAKTSIWLDTLPKVLKLCFPDLRINAIKSDYYIVLPNGSEIWICGLDDSNRVEKVLGKEYSTLYFNECSQIEYSSVRVAMTRLAEKNNLTKKIYYDQNPPSKAHWTYWVFEKKVNPEENIPIANPESYTSIRINPIDNLENIDAEYISMLDELPERDRLRFKEGVYVDDGLGTAYYSFSREKNVKEMQNHNGTIFIGMDFNVNPMTAVVGELARDMIIIHDELFLPNSDTYKMSDELTKRKYFGNIIPDSTGRNRKTSGTTDFQILKERGFNVLDTRNPYVVDRVNNMNRLLHSGSIIINPRCVKLIADLERVQWDKNGDDLDEGKDKQLTHISDALGYLAWKLLPMIKQKQATVGYYA